MGLIPVRLESSQIKMEQSKLRNTILITVLEIQKGPVPFAVPGADVLEIVVCQDYKNEYQDDEVVDESDEPEDALRDDIEG